MKRLFIVAIILFLSNFHIVSAEITNPYTIDEKSQVMFGDSTGITYASSMYQGLENYAHEYVNDYLHLTFTYTHVGCCTASYPPKGDNGKGSRGQADSPHGRLHILSPIGNCLLFEHVGI